MPRPAALQLHVSESVPESKATVVESIETSYGARRGQCERFDVIVKKDGRRRYRRARKRWSPADRKRFRSLVGLVARDMGAEPRLFQAWALRESTYRPSAVHVLNPDIEGAATTWRRYAYNPREEASLARIVERGDKTSRAYWRAKTRLAKVRTFKENPYLGARVEYDLVNPDGTVSRSEGSAWAFGYGPFGFNPTYFLPVWDARSPPWVFCHNDGLIAVVTAVWSARAHQRECERMGIAGTYTAINHRFGAGHCAKPPENARFKTRARRVGLDPDARARLGRKWKRSETDRTALLVHLRRKAVAAGLLPRSVLAGS